ncbi:3-hydroxyacyl-ACP dehydratase FabZ [Fodinicurvata fenggangensis]|uniref:3-hydroxyacyl-ACP dehydratase FabZ n=1 Tax=Fodinicurvata fenggangensis TaxID=1121830 RepID=UPI00047CEBE3|nr:3-hydroxyacyl-ACP dehydratase FabZ [Fodinicurvata fenggangensis]
MTASRESGSETSKDKPELSFDVMDVMRMIPHRYPMLLVDRILELERDKHALGLKNVTINEGFFQGHFPRQPVMPGVLIVEAMAQTAAVLVVETLEGAAAGKLVYFMSVEQARFRRPVVPGDQLHIHVSKVRNRGPVWKFEGEVRVDDQVAAEAGFSAMIREDD